MHDRGAGSTDLRVPTSEDEVSRQPQARLPGKGDGTRSYGRPGEDRTHEGRIRRSGLAPICPARLPARRPSDFRRAPSSSTQLVTRHMLSGKTVGPAMDCAFWTCPRPVDTPDVGVSPRGGSPNGEAGGGKAPGGPRALRVIIRAPLLKRLA